MLLRSCRSNFKLIRTCLCGVQGRYYSSEKKAEPCQQGDELNHTLGEIGSKYRIFRDADAKVMLDVDEESSHRPEIPEEEPELEVDPFSGLNLQRGVDGVFEIEDLVEVLKTENAEDVFVASVPADIKYVDYICIVSAKSYRHMSAIAQFVRRVFKQKKHDGDIIPRLEGKDSREWMALDLGNIALHILSRGARQKYDLDTLWSVGPKFDAESNKEDPVVEMLEKYSVYLKELQPAS